MPKTIISIQDPTPKWATWAFRVVFLVTSALSIWVAATNLVPQSAKVEALLAMKCLDLIVWGIGRGLGVKKEDYEN